MPRLVTLIFSLCATLAAVVSGNVVAQVDPRWAGASVRDLWNEYGNIFKHGNRNAASHLWSSFLMQRAATMTEAKFTELSGGYCAVSGSPVTPMGQTRSNLHMFRTDGVPHGFQRLSLQSQRLWVVSGTA